MRVDLEDYYPQSDQETLSGVTSVSFWYFGVASGTLSITAQTYVSGAAATNNGYTYAGLELSIEANPSQNQGTAALTLPQNSVIDLARGGVNPYIQPPDHDIVVGYFVPFLEEFQGRAINLLTGVSRFNWYLITISAMAQTIGTSVSRFSAYVGPVSFSIV